MLGKLLSRSSSLINPGWNKTSGRTRRPCTVTTRRREVLATILPGESENRELKEARILRRTESHEFASRQPRELPLSRLSRGEAGAPVYALKHSSWTDNAR